METTEHSEDAQATSPIKNDTETEIKKTPREDGLISLGEYNKEVSKQLPKEIFQREPTRLKWGVLFYGGMAAIIYAFFNLEMILPVKILLSILMGMFLGSGAFLGHEIIHGSIVKGKRLQYFLGFFGFAPFLISPTFWRF